MLGKFIGLKIAITLRATFLEILGNRPFVDGIKGRMPRTR
jgi:hypothetical protein